MPLSHGSRDGMRTTRCVIPTGTGDDCGNMVVPNGPIPLCGRHLRLAYEFAHTLVDATWRDHLRDVIGIPEPTSDPEPTPSWVYFLRRHDRLKIGYTTDPATRFTSLKADEILHVEAGDMGHERALHAMFAEHWITGEWFRPAPEILAYIAARRASAA